jgi:hypothetical protein
MSDEIDTISRLNRRGVQWTKSPLYSHVISDPNAPLYYVYRHYHVKVVDGVEREFSYVGFAANPTSRWSFHKTESCKKHRCGYDYVFKRAIRKYGSDVFLHEILFASDERDLSLAEMEPRFVKAFRSFIGWCPSFGYNATLGGQGRRGLHVTESFIAERALEYRALTGNWPKATTEEQVPGGHIRDTWGRYEYALREGLRGLPGGSSLAKLLSERFGVPNKAALPRLTEDFVSDMALGFFWRHGSWPTQYSGRVDGGYETDTWSGYNTALMTGARGLLGGSSLAKLFEDRFGVQNISNKRPINTEFILERAAEHNRSKGRWPSVHSGKVENGHPGDTWAAYHSALYSGARGLPGGSSLAKLLAPLKNRHRNKDSG